MIYYLSAFIFLCIGCTGYHSLNQPLSYKESPLSIAIPVIKGDVDGILRNALVEEFSTSGGYCYKPRDAKYDLVVKIVSNTKDRIGYKYDQQPISGKRIQRLVPNEGRKSVDIDATLVDRFTKKKIKGPIRVSGFADYDYVNSNSFENMTVDPESGNFQSVLAYSLGQLGSEEEASNAALNPAFRSVAKKTANYFRIALSLQKEH
jgi:hypothetical protein